MTCREATEFLLDYLDGNLPPAVAAELGVHLEICGWCPEYVAGYRKTVAITQTLSSEEPSCSSEKKLNST